MLEIKLPELGENIAQGTISKILVKVGDNVKKGQNILELETDKAVLEVPSSQDGSVKEILIKAGQTVKVGQSVFVFDGKSAASPASSIPEAKTISATQHTQTPKSSGTSSAAATTATTNAILEMKIPGLGENILQGTVTKILVQKNDFIKKGQNVIELETDKAVLEVPSSMEGTIEEVLIKSGEIIKVGQSAFKIKGSGSPTNIVPATTQSAVKTTETPTTKQEAQISQTVPSMSAYKAIAEPAKNVSAAPSVRRFAREIGIDITTVSGTGPGGRISVEDVKAHAKKILTSISTGGGFQTASVPLPDFSKWGSVERQPMNNVRKKTAEHLTHAWQSIPHVTQFDKADITELEKLRKGLSTKGKKISITPFIIKVVAAALKKFPQFNASVDMSTNEIIYKKYVNIGVAVDTDRGLLVPVLKNVDQLSIEQISDELTAIAQRARDRKTTLDQMQGGTFTISNLGGIGGTFFTPIVNWPEVAIIGVSRGVMEPAYVDDQFVPKLMLPISLSYDHRLIDGADGARFIRWVCEAIQQPSL